MISDAAHSNSSELSQFASVAWAFVRYCLLYSAAVGLSFTEGSDEFAIAARNSSVSFLNKTFFSTGVIAVLSAYVCGLS